MDSWTAWRLEKLRQMQQGGNRRARLYFEANDVPRAPIKARYESLGALRYASMLQALGAGCSFDERSWTPPHWYVQQQQRSIGSPTQNSPLSAQEGRRFTGMGSTPAPPSSQHQQISGEWYSAVSSGWGFVTDKTSSLARTATDAFRHTDVDGVKNSLSRGWATVSSTVSMYANELSHKINQEEDGLAGMTQQARFAGAGQQQMPTVNGRFDHVEHIASPTVANEWRSPTSASLGHGSTSRTNIQRGVTVAGSDSPTTNDPMYCGKPVSRPKEDDWFWND